MKIMIITLDTNGGMIHYVSQLANSLAKAEDVVVMAPIGVDRTNFQNDIKIIELKMGNVLKNFFTNIFLLNHPIKFLRTIYYEDPDIIHFNENHLWAALFLPFLTKFKIVTMIHDVNPHMGSRKIDQVIAKRLYIKFSDCILVHGEYAKNKLKTSKKCYSIPHGDYSFFLNYSKDIINEEDDTVLFFGRIENYKGLDYLIKSINYISDRNPGIKLIIAGSGDLNKFKDLIKNNKNYEIHNRFIKDEEVPIFFQRAKILVLPYLECTQTGIIPIAYAFKKPVIVTDVGSIPEVVDEGKTGFIVPPKDSEALAKAIEVTLNDDKLMKKMGYNGYIKMKNELSWDLVNAKLINIYKEVLGKRC